MESIFHQEESILERKEERMERSVEYSIHGSGSTYVYAILGERVEESFLLEFPSITLVEIIPKDWEEDLSPWPSDNPFKGGKRFSGGADAFLESIENNLMGKIEKGRVENRILMGYSMGGLFSLYAATRSEKFNMASSVSGSLWFPGFSEYLSLSSFFPKKVYLSIGERENKTRNHVLSTVLEKTRQVTRSIQKKNSEAVMRIEEGGHFYDAEGRLKRALSWLLEDSHD